MSGTNGRYMPYNSVSFVLDFPKEFQPHSGLLSSHKNRGEIHELFSDAGLPFFGFLQFAGGDS